MLIHFKSCKQRPITTEILVGYIFNVKSQDDMIKAHCFMAENYPLRASFSLQTLASVPSMTTFTIMLVVSKIHYVTQHTRTEVS